MTNYIPALDTTTPPPWEAATPSPHPPSRASGGGNGHHVVNGGYFNQRHHHRFSVPSKCYQVPDIPNGTMRCIETHLGRKCTPECDSGHAFYQKFTSRPPTYYCNARRADWEIRRFIPDCSPVSENQR